MTAVTAVAPITNLEIVEAFANKTKAEGEKVYVRPVSDTSFRINFWKGDSIVRSLFVIVSGDKVDIPKQ